MSKGLREYYLIIDFGTKVECLPGQPYYEPLGYESEADLMTDNGGVEPDVVRITRDEYLLDDGYDIA